ncbi:MAG TPA: hypothetical protein VGH38_11900, partial [Bryobacteraceae bacterium]
MPGSRYLRFAAYGAGGLLILLGLLLAFAHTRSVKQFGLQQAERILRGQGIGLQASKLDYNLITGRLELLNVRVQSMQTPDLPPLLLADRIAVAIQLRPLLSGAYYLEDAAIDNPQVQVVVAADGRDNIPRPPKKNGPSPTVDYLVRKLLISGGAVRVKDRRQQLTALLPLDRLTVDGDPLTRNHRVSMRSKDGGQVALAGHSLPLRGIALDAVVEKDAVQIGALRAPLGESSVSVSGRISGFDDPRFDVHGDASLALAPLAEFANDPRKVRGTVNAAFTATGPVAG